MRKFILLALLLVANAVVACAGGAGSRTRPDVQKVDAPNPALTIQRPDITPAAMDPKLTPGGGRTPQVGRTPSGRLTLPAKLPTPGGTLAVITRPPVTVANATAVGSYDATQMITTFANQYLGAPVNVTRAGGLKADVNVPSVQQAEVNAAVSVAGENAVGLVALNNSQGGAEVAVGSGSVSGDLNADISGASLGAYSLMAKSAPPADANAALNLLHQYFPALASVNLQPQSSTQGGFAFYATTTHQGVDWKTKQVTEVAEAIAAGTNRQGPSTIVWVVAGNGTFAGGVKP
jgi:hypothetical protein